MRKSLQDSLILGGATAVMIALLIVIGGCGFLPIDISGRDKTDPVPTGELRLTVNEPMTPMIVLPDQNNTVAHYLVQIQHATSGADPIVQDVPAPPPVEGVTFPNLPSGLYNIQILGLCSPEEEVITDAFDTALIAVNDETTVIMQMEIVDGLGDIEIDLTITPYDLVPFDEIVGEFYDGTWAEQVWTQASQGVWGYGRTETPGYYLHRWQLWSMGAEPLGPLTGACEAIYVRNNRTSAGLYELDENNIVMPDEGAALIIIWEVEQPIQTFFVDSVSTVYLGEPYLLQTTSDADPLDVHSWYENGQLLVGEITPDYAGTAPMEPGFSNFSKVGQKGGICTSAQKLVIFAEEPPEITTITFTDPTVPTYLNGSQTGSFPLAVEVLDQNNDPMVDNTTIYWRIVSADPEFHDVCRVQVDTSVTTNGTAANVFELWDLIGNEHYGAIEAAGDPDFLGVVAVSPEIGVGNF